MDAYAFELAVVYPLEIHGAVPGPECQFELTGFVQFRKLLVNKCKCKETINSSKLNVLFFIVNLHCLAKSARNKTCSLSVFPCLL